MGESKFTGSSFSADVGPYFVIFQGARGLYGKPGKPGDPGVPVRCSVF